MRINSVDKGGFARTGHADGDYHYRLFLVFLFFRRHRCSRQDVVYYLIFVHSTTQACTFQNRSLGVYQPYRPGRLARSLPPPFVLLHIRKLEWLKPLHPSQEAEAEALVQTRGVRPLQEAEDADLRICIGLLQVVRTTNDGSAAGTEEEVMDAGGDADIRPEDSYRRTRTRQSISRPTKASRMRPKKRSKRPTVNWG